MSASLNPDAVKEFGEIGSAEYRALSITAVLYPQIDLATEPRWMWFCDTFGEHTQMTIDMIKAYCDGFQTTKGGPDGWGKDSVNTMVKHFPGAAQERQDVMPTMVMENMQCIRERISRNISSHLNKEHFLWMERQGKPAL